MPGDAEQLDGQPAGQHVLLRLEAALDTLPGGNADTELPSRPVESRNGYNHLLYIVLQR